nr:hypothetical protein [Nitrosomonas nitrosa]
MDYKCCNILKMDENDRSLSAAGAALGRIPRNHKREWTGWLGDHHLKKGDLLITPSGEIRPVYGAYRSRIILWKLAVPLDGGLPADVFPGGVLRRFKNPHAVRLGQAKRGMKEVRSDAKREACRRNGKVPPRPGSRPRGRPRRTHS